jgi:N-acetylglucosamine malate deacetylase 2
VNVARPLTVAGSFFLEREQPDVVVTMEPTGVTAHPDHMAASAATKAAFAAYAAGPRPREPRFYYWGVPVSEVVATSTVAEQAYRALRQHRTQAGDPAYRLLAQRDNWRAVFAGSQYIRVHPAPQPGDAPESSLVEAFGDG